MSYQDLILSAVPGCNPRHVEAWMRLRWGCLDGLSRDEFVAEARLAGELACADPALSEQMAVGL